jgi:hypothetical protein
MKGRERIPIAIALSVVAIAISACGEEEEVRYSDKQIIEQLDLEETDDGYAIDGDPFCAVEPKLLNDGAEVEQAVAGRNGNLVLASRAGNVGVKGLPGFAPDCAERARKKLNKLDPVPKE